jgi:hypothetical protein
MERKLTVVNPLQVNLIPVALKCAVEQATMSAIPPRTTPIQIVTAQLPVTMIEPIAIPEPTEGVAAIHLVPKPVVDQQIGLAQEHQVQTQWTPIRASPVAVPQAPGPAQTIQVQLEPEAAARTPVQTATPIAMADNRINSIAINGLTDEPIFFICGNLEERKLTTPDRTS